MKTYDGTVCMKGQMTVRVGEQLTGGTGGIVLTCVSWFQTTTVPLYRLITIHGSVGCRSTLFTRSDRAVSFRLMSNRRGFSS